MSGIIETIKRAILASKTSRRQIAIKADVPPSAISRLLTGEQGIGIEAAERLAGVLDLQITIGPRKGGRKSKGA